jgi:hypothetical protein
MLHDWIRGHAPGALTHGAKREMPVSTNFSNLESNGTSEENGFGRLESAQQPAARLADWKDGMAPGALSHGSEAVRRQSTKYVSQKTESPVGSNKSNKLVDSTKKIIMSLKLAKLPAVVEQLHKEEETSVSIASNRVKGSKDASGDKEDEELGRAIREAFLEKHEPSRKQSSLEESKSTMEMKNSVRILLLLCLFPCSVYGSFVFNDAGDGSNLQHVFIWKPPVIFSVHNVTNHDCILLLGAVDHKLRGDIIENDWNAAVVGSLFPSSWPGICYSVLVYRKVLSVAESDGLPGLRINVTSVRRCGSK